MKLEFHRENRASSFPSRPKQSIQFRGKKISQWNSSLWNSVPLGKTEHHHTPLGLNRAFSSGKKKKFPSGTRVYKTRVPLSYYYFFFVIFYFFFKSHIFFLWSFVQMRYFLVSIVNIRLMVFQGLNHIWLKFDGISSIVNIHLMVLAEGLNHIILNFINEFF